MPARQREPNWAQWSQLNWSDWGVRSINTEDGSARRGCVTIVREIASKKGHLP
ncbi:hypothetical protein RMSM_02783 [Rhodopirellula maiorica SM1]|uniref:Uncharacterized protein n=1 Tax=Rhodopirellula maiorica SM1 TaxID=1265738 RepID=M5RM55_9BACT|nr:hypothetical protein RMSM_02783 [Rhodopirellula maiorica SM1]